MHDHEKGFHGASVEDICERAGFTRGAFYSNFAALDDLVVELYGQHARALSERVKSLSTRDDLCPEQILAAVLDVWSKTPTSEDQWYLLQIEFTLYAIRNKNVGRSRARQQSKVRADLASLVERVAARHAMRLSVTPQEFAASPRRSTRAECHSACCNRKLSDAAASSADSYRWCWLPSPSTELACDYDLNRCVPTRDRAWFLPDFGSTVRRHQVRHLGVTTMTELTTITDEVRPSETGTVTLEHPGPRVIASLEALRACIGTHLGVSDWMTVDQPRINRFAEVTRDQQWIHVDATRAEDGPFGATIAHGMLTLSLCSSLLWEVAVVDGMGAAINYGLNKVRFPAPLLVGSRVRMHVSVTEVTDIARGVEVVYHLTYETQGQDKPPCVADLVLRYYNQN